MDETAMAFEMPHVRAAATQGAAPLDRISVRDYTRDVEIGAFRSERGVTQRIRFNVVLEVSHHSAAEDDDVDKVISYDTITEAIEAQLSNERINLLETLAERIAARCLADARAVRVFVRIEKLDRIPGALGVEIMRARNAGAATPLRPIDAAQATDPAALRARVVYLGSDVLNGPLGDRWRVALGSFGAPFVLCLGPAAPQVPARSEGQLRIGLLAIEQNVWAFADAALDFTVVSSRTELDWALRSGKRAIWAPTKMLTDALARPAADASRPLDLAGWLAAEIGAETLTVCGSAREATEAPLAVAQRHATAPGALADLR